MGNDKYTFTGVFNFQDEEAEKEIKRLRDSLETLATQLDNATASMEAYEGEIRELKAENEALERGTGVDVLKRRLEDFRNTANSAAEEFRAFLQTANLTDVDRNYEWRYEEYFEKIRKGAMTVNQAITEVKANVGSFADGDGGSQALQAFSASLKKIGDACDSILEKINDLEVNGIKSIGETATSNFTNVTQALAEIQKAAGNSGGDIGDSYDKMQALLESLTQYANIDETKLWRISEAFRSIADIGQGRFGTSTVNNILNLVSKLSSLTSSGSLNINFNAQGFNELKVSKSSYANLATYLPEIAKVDAKKLEALSKINLSNFNNLKVSKSSVEAISQLAALVTSSLAVQQNDKEKKSEKKKSQAQTQKEAVDAYKEMYRLQKQTYALSKRDSNARTTFSEVFEAYDEAVDKVNRLTEAQDQYAKSTEAVKKAEKDYDIAAQNRDKASETQWRKLTDNASNFLERNAFAESRNEDYKKAADNIRDILATGKSDNWQKLNDNLNQAARLLHQNGLETETWWQKMQRTFGSRMRSLLAGLALGKITQTLRDVYKNVVNIDTAMTNLRIVTQANEKALDNYRKTAEKTAQKIGASVSELINSTTTYARLGFSLEESSILSEITTAYSKVADVGIDEATRNITGIVKAYDVNVDELESVTDRLIYVGRNFAISSAEIGEGMNNAAASLAANGNSLNEAMGILAAANTTVQDISRASTATRTITARLSASKQELEELGETVTADTVVKLEKAFKAYGIAITGSNGKLLSTYTILDNIAAKWSQLDEAERSAITSLAAGKIVPVYTVMCTMNTFNCR